MKQNTITARTDNAGTFPATMDAWNDEHAKHETDAQLLKRVNADKATFDLALSMDVINRDADAFRNAQPSGDAGTFPVLQNRFTVRLHETNGTNIADALSVCYPVDSKNERTFDVPEHLSRLYVDYNSIISNAFSAWDALPKRPRKTKTTDAQTDAMKQYIDAIESIESREYADAIESIESRGLILWFLIGQRNQTVYNATRGFDDETRFLLVAGYAIASRAVKTAIRALYKTDSASVNGLLFLEQLERGLPYAVLSAYGNADERAKNNAFNASADVLNETLFALTRGTQRDKNGEPIDVIRHAFSSASRFIRAERSTDSASRSHVHIDAMKQQLQNNADADADAKLHADANGDGDAIEHADSADGTDGDADAFRVDGLTLRGLLSNVQYTDVERMVLRLLADGLTQTNVCARLFHSTDAKHKQRVYRIVQNIRKKTKQYLHADA